MNLIMKINVAFFFGGKSVEHEVSIISAQQAMAAADKGKYNILPIYISKEGEMYTGAALCEVETFKDMKKVKQQGEKITFVRDNGKVLMLRYPKPLLGSAVVSTVDVAVPVMHGTNGEDGTLQGYLEMLGLPFGGCNILSSAVGMDKIMMKKLLKEQGIPVLDCVYFYGWDWYKSQGEYIEKVQVIGYPVIVKSANLGSSVGIKKAADEQELIEAVEFACQFSDRILVEKAIVKLTEINCSILGDSENAIASVCEQPVGADEILSYDDKYKGSAKGMSGAKRLIPAPICSETESAIKAYCLETFKILSCAGVARVDCMIDGEDGSIYVNEINTIPGSLSFYLWERAGIDFTALIDALIDIAFKRQRERDNMTFSHSTNLLELQGGAKGAKGGAKI